MATLKPDFQVSAYLLDNPVPPAVEVVGLEAIAYDSVYGRAGDELTFQVAATVPRLNDKAGQIMLDKLLSAAGALSLKAAVEADRQLTSRLLDDNTVQTGQAAACSDLRVTQYNGQSPATLPNQTQVVLATWSVQVIT